MWLLELDTDASKRQRMERKVMLCGKCSGCR